MSAVARDCVSLELLTDMFATLYQKALVGFERVMELYGVAAVVVQLQSRKSPAKSFPRLRRVGVGALSAFQLRSPRGRGGLLRDCPLSHTQLGNTRTRNTHIDFTFIMVLALALKAELNGYYMVHRRSTAAKAPTE